MLFIEPIRISKNRRVNAPNLLFGFPLLLLPQCSLLLDVVEWVMLEELRWRHLAAQHVGVAVATVLVELGLDRLLQVGDRVIYCFCWFKKTCVIFALFLTWVVYLMHVCNTFQLAETSKEWSQMLSVLPFPKLPPVAAWSAVFIRRLYWFGRFFELFFRV